jgi:hypothetical protein
MAPTPPGVPGCAAVGAAVVAATTIRELEARCMGTAARTRMWMTTVTTSRGVV